MWLGHDAAIGQLRPAAEAASLLPGSSPLSASPTCPHPSLPPAAQALSTAQAQVGDAEASSLAQSAASSDFGATAAAQTFARVATSEWQCAGVGVGLVQQHDQHKWRWRRRGMR